MENEDEDDELCIVSAVVVAVILSPIQDTCRRRQGIQVDTRLDTTCIPATCIRCKRDVRKTVKRELH